MRARAFVTMLALLVASESALERGEVRAATNPPPSAALTSPIAVPETPMLLTRVVKRELLDGKYITVRRVWRIKFAPCGDGYRVDGKQVDVSVDAPPPLAALASVEKARVEKSMFPVVLDKAGQIVPQEVEGAPVPCIGPKPSEPTPETSIEKDLKEAALKTVKSKIGDTQMAAKRAEEANRFIDGAMRSRAAERRATPNDFFFPVTLSWQKREPSGETEGGARMTVSFVAERDPNSRLLRRSVRKIDAVVGNTKRHSGEEWTLEPAS